MIEARTPSGSSTIQIVLRHPGQQLGISLDQTYDFLADPRLRPPG